MTTQPIIDSRNLVVGHKEYDGGRLTRIVFNDQIADCPDFYRFHSEAWDEQRQAFIDRREHLPVDMPLMKGYRSDGTPNLL